MEEDHGITSIKFIENVQQETHADTPLLIECVKQLDEYFNSQREKFDLKLNIQGTEFQKKVWSELSKIF